MPRALAVLTLALAAFCIEMAWAQSRWCSMPPTGPADCSFKAAAECRAAMGGKEDACIPAAPVGHRQPRASDIPKNIPTDPIDVRIEQINRLPDLSLQLCTNC